MTAVFLTIDTEFAWRHHAAGHDVAGIHARSIEPAGVGLAWQLATLARHGLKATFFVDPLHTLVYGKDALAPMVDGVLAAGQEVQLHIHPHWTGAHAEVRGDHGKVDLVEYGAAQQRDMLAHGIELLVAAGAPRPVAFRAGSYAANDDTLCALAALGILYDSSHNGAHAPWPSAIALPATQIAPVARRGVVEVPVTVIEDRPGALRNFQICALSVAEMRAALLHAIAEKHVATTIVGHSFELATRSGTAPNRVHVARFEALCALLDKHRGDAPTMHFANRPVLPLGHADVPLAPSTLRLRWRQVEQAWSTLVEERAA